MDCGFFFFFFFFFVIRLPKRSRGFIAFLEGRGVLSYGQFAGAARTNAV